MEGITPASRAVSEAARRRGFRLAQVFDGDTPVFTEPVIASRDDNGMAQSLTFRVVCGSWRDRLWCLDIEVGEWNGLPRIVSVKTEDYARSDDLSKVGSC